MERPSHYVRSDASIMHTRQGAAGRQEGKTMIRRGERARPGFARVVLVGAMLVLGTFLMLSTVGCASTLQERFEQQQLAYETVEAAVTIAQASGRLDERTMEVVLVFQHAAKAALDQMEVAVVAGNGSEFQIGYRMLLAAMSSIANEIPHENEAVVHDTPETSPGDQPSGDQPSPGGTN